MMPDTIIRTATADDCDAMAAVHISAWRESYSDIRPSVAFRKMDIENRTKLWRRRLGELLPVYVAELDNEIAGFADGGPARAAEALETEMQVYAVYLLNRAKRQGIGTKLLLRGVQQFLADGQIQRASGRSGMPFRHGGSMNTTAPSSQPRSWKTAKIMSGSWSDMFDATYGKSLAR
jgi:L-amino acid N-acyltransferase YncA